jgi:hypothetical protein
VVHEACLVSFAQAVNAIIATYFEQIIAVHFVILDPFDFSFLVLDDITHVLATSAYVRTYTSIQTIVLAVAYLVNVVSFS